MRQGVQAGPTPALPVKASQAFTPSREGVFAKILDFMKSKQPRLIRPSRRATALRVKQLPAEALFSFFRPLKPQMIQWLTRLVNTDTPSDQKQPLDQLANWFAGQFRRCGAQSEIIKNREAGNHLLARWTCPGTRRKPILILGHLDTVWDLGESRRRPARIENGKLFGPGAVDMRGGLTLVLALAKYLGARSSTLERTVTVLLDSDEEIGSHTSRFLIEAEARRVRQCW